MITVIILTYNESLHLKRLLDNIQPLNCEVIVVDSFSTDNTEQICKEYNVRFYQNPFINQAEQVNWAIKNLEFNFEWIFRLDADEYLTPELLQEISSKMDGLPADVNGVAMKRRVYFMDKWIKRGGYYPTWLTRIWRNGYGVYENKWMDEHLIIDGKTIQFEHDFIDHNLNNVTWWIAKHNSYATREAIEILNKKYDFLDSSSISSSLGSKSQSESKRWLKEKIYNNLFPFIRPFLYFAFRYFFKLGFLDGKQGFMWHILQGFWYRFLVDVKVMDIERRSKKSGRKIIDIITDDYKINLK